jgi:hypothetical protein
LSAFRDLVVDIIGMASDEQMVDPHAKRGVAFVEYEGRGLNLPMDKHPRVPVGQDRFFCDADTSVAIDTIVAGPQPAISGSIHPGPKPFGRISVSIPKATTRGAESHLSKIWPDELKATSRADVGKLLSSHDDLLTVRTGKGFVRDLTPAEARF